MSAKVSTAYAPSSFLPCGAVTGIGSLPLRDAKEAFRFVAEFSPDVPFWPQLPKRSPREHVVLQGIGPLAALVEPRRFGHGYVPGPLHQRPVR